MYPTFCFYSFFERSFSFCLHLFYKNLFDKLEFNLYKDNSSNVSIVFNIYNSKVYILILMK